MVRRDLADVFATRTEGVKGQQAVDWGLVDAIAPRSRFDDVVRERALARAGASDRPAAAPGVALTPLEVDGRPRRAPVRAGRGGDRPGARRRAPHRARCPRAATGDAPTSSSRPAPRPGCSPRPRQLDDAMLRLRFNEPEIGTWVLHTAGDAADVVAADELLRDHADHWLVREIRLLLGAHAEAARPLGPFAGRARRARELLRRPARRAGAGRRPVVHARRDRCGRAIVRRPASA